MKSPLVTDLPNRCLRGLRLRMHRRSCDDSYDDRKNARECACSLRFRHLAPVMRPACGAVVLERPRSAATVYARTYKTTDKEKRRSPARAAPSADALVRCRGVHG